VREKDGKTPQGTLLEHAASRVHAVVPEPDPATQREAIALALRQSLRLGITTVHTMCESVEEVAHYLAVRERLRRPELRFGFLKGFLDGVIESRTAYMLEPYVGTAERGKPNYEPDELLALVSRANAEGVPVALHAIGDAAVRMALTAYEAAARSQRGRVRNRIEHVEVLHPDDYPRFAALDVVASMQPYHAVPLDAPSQDDVWSANLGPARLAHSFPWRALLDAGAPLAFGSDWNVFTQDPLKGLAVAVTRQNERGLPAGGAQPQQRLTLEQALRAYTEGVAYAEGPAPGPEPTHSFVVVEGLDPSDPRTLWTARVRAVVHRGRLTTFE
jgi:predicted amidohydrolase YtcJ